MARSGPALEAIRGEGLASGAPPFASCGQNPSDGHLLQGESVISAVCIHRSEETLSSILSRTFLFAERSNQPIILATSKSSAPRGPLCPVGNGMVLTCQFLPCSSRKIVASRYVWVRCLCVPHVQKQANPVSHTHSLKLYLKVQSVSKKNKRTSG